MWEFKIEWAEQQNVNKYIDKGFAWSKNGQLTRNEGDWTCVCEFHNSMNNTICGGKGVLGCKLPWYRAVMEKAGIIIRIEGEMPCPKCHERGQIAYQQTCVQCNSTMCHSCKNESEGIKGQGWPVTNMCMTCVNQIRTQNEEMEAYQRKQRELLADAIMCQEIEQKDQLGLSGSMSIQSLGRGERMEPEDLSAAWSGADQDEGVEYVDVAFDAN